MASTSGDIEQIEFGPAKVPWKQTIRTKIPLPQYIKITWRAGGQTTLDPSLFSEGQSRDVLWGTDVETGKKADVVIKLQTSDWHNTSNVHEFLLANKYMGAFTPKFHGVHKVRYASKHPAYMHAKELSVSVVDKIVCTAKEEALKMIVSPLEIAGVFVIMAWVRWIFFYPQHF